MSNNANWRFPTDITAVTHKKSEHFEHNISGAKKLLYSENEMKEVKKKKIIDVLCSAQRVHRHHTSAATYFRHYALDY